VSAKTESKSKAKVLVEPNVITIFNGCMRRDYKTVNFLGRYRHIDNLNNMSDSHTHGSERKVVDVVRRVQSFFWNINILAVECGIRHLH
jgi:hypothetical protein